MRKKLKVLSVGGGSGGHVTPVVAVMAELRKRQKAIELRFWCDTHFAPQAKKIIGNYDERIRVQTVIAGKLRRYHHLKWWQHFTIPSVIFPNIRDTFLVGAGIVQSFVRLIVWRPDIVFAKGGYVCLPVGLAARLLRIPLVIHDSDAHAGLTNRLLAPMARSIATGVSLRHYNYPASKTTYVGIPIDSAYRPYSPDEQAAAKKQLGFDAKKPLVVVIGGGLGSRQINQAVAKQLPLILPHANVYLISGAAQYDEMRSLTPQADSRFKLKDFVAEGLVDVIGAADIVVSRAGATALLELAAMAKPTILIPSKRLVWQVKHAAVYVEEQAVVALDEDRFDEDGDTSLAKTIRGLLKNKSIREKLAERLYKMARPQAAYDMAAIILRVAKRRR